MSGPVWVFAAVPSCAFPRDEHGAATPAAGLVECTAVVTPIPGSDIAGKYAVTARYSFMAGDGFPEPGQAVGHVVGSRSFTLTVGPPSPTPEAARAPPTARTADAESDTAPAPPGTIQPLPFCTGKERTAGELINASGALHFGVHGCVYPRWNRSTLLLVAPPPLPLPPPAGAAARPGRGRRWVLMLGDSRMRGLFWGLIQALSPATDLAGSESFKCWGMLSVTIGHLTLVYRDCRLNKQSVHSDPLRATGAVVPLDVTLVHETVNATRAQAGLGPDSLPDTVVAFHILAAVVEAALPDFHGTKVWVSEPPSRFGDSSLNPNRDRGKSVVARGTYMAPFLRDVVDDGWVVFDAHRIGSALMDYQCDENPVKSIHWHTLCAVNGRVRVCGRVNELLVDVFITLILPNDVSGGYQWHTGSESGSGVHRRNSRGSAAEHVQSGPGVLGRLDAEPHRSKLEVSRSKPEARSSLSDKLSKFIKLRAVSGPGMQVSSTCSACATSLAETWQSLTTMKTPLSCVTGFPPGNNNAGVTRRQCHRASRVWNAPTYPCEPFDGGSVSDTRR